MSASFQKHSCVLPCVNLLRVLYQFNVVCISGSAYTVPGFSGINSYLRLKKIDQAYRQVTIEMTFKALSNEGILLYSGKNMNGTGDFISLSIKDGFVEFRYGCIILFTVSA